MASRSCRRGVEMLPNSCCFVFPYQKSHRSGLGARRMDGERDEARKKKSGGGANCHPPQGTPVRFPICLPNFYEYSFCDGEA